MCLASRRIRLDRLTLVGHTLDAEHLVLDLAGPHPGRRRAHPFGGPVFSFRTAFRGWAGGRVLDQLDEWAGSGAPLVLRVEERRRRGRQRCRTVLTDGFRSVTITAVFAPPAPADAPPLAAEAA